VLITGGYSSGYLASAELYNPATGIWTATGSLNMARYAHTETLLPSGQVLITGGNGTNSAYLASAELFNAGLGFLPGWQPQISTFNPVLLPGSSLVLSGTGFRGIAEGSCGDTQDSPSDYPVVQLRSLESGQTIFTGATNWSTNAYASTPVAKLPGGWTLATMFVNGIPSTSVILFYGSAPAFSPNPVLNANGSLTLEAQTMPNLSSRLYFTTNLAAPVVWLPIYTNLNGGVWQFTDTNTSGFTTKFYHLSTP
jgi:hypothetical protein